MKINYQLQVDGAVIPILTIKTALTHMTAGRGVITTKTALKPHQLVSIQLGYEKLQTWFTGYVDKVEQLSINEHRAILREPAAILNNPLPLSIVHPTLKQILDNISAKTGLMLACPTHDAVKQIPNLTHMGTGYALLAQLGQMFGLKDYTWFSKPDGSIWLGSWIDCHWSAHPLNVPENWFHGQTVVSGVIIPMLPALRPDSVINGKRVKQLVFDGDSLTLQWQSENMTKREIKQLFPELANQTHLSLIGRITAVCESVNAGHIQTAWRPAYGVDVQLLHSDGSDNTCVPLFKNVPLSGAMAQGQGQFSFAQPNTLVELGFAFGHTDKPFIRTILGQHISMPGLNNGDYICQFNDASHAIDSGGNQTLHTEQLQTLTSQSQVINTDKQEEHLGQHTRLVDGHDNETALGQRTIQSNWLTLLSLAGTQMGTEQNHEVHVGENLLETIGKLRQSIAATHWAGSTDTNIYQLLAELMTVVEALAKTTSSHTHTAPHGGTTPPNQSGAITAHGNQAKQLHDKLTPLI